MTSTLVSPTTPADRPGDLLAAYDWPRAWRAHWLGAEPPASNPHAGPNFDAAVGGEFARHLFRRTFALTHVPGSAPLRVTADSRYALYVNGVEAGRGPVRSQPRRMRYDSYDIAPLLIEGDNTIVVLVTYYGTANSYWQPSAVNEHLGNAGILALEVRLGPPSIGTEAIGTEAIGTEAIGTEETGTEETGTEWVVTDQSWDVLAATAWTSPARDGLDGVPVEVLDARLLPADWRTGAGSGWHSASIRPAGHLGALARSQPPTDPYGPLLPRPIGALGGALVTPTRATILAGAAAAKPTDSPVTGVLAVWPELAADGSDARSDADGDTDRAEITVEVGAGQSRGVEIDFGRIVVGLVRFAVEAPEGTVLDLLYREKPAGSGDAALMSIPRIGARYVARGHHDVFEAREVNGFRLAQLVITAPGDAAATVIVRDLAVREYLYPEAGEAFFDSSDAELNRLYRAGRRTVAANASDAFTDCPTREQRAWVGDGIVHQHVHLTTSTDWRLARWYVELADSPRPDGILPMSVVGEIEHSQQHTIADWSLNWVHGVHTLFDYDPAADDLVRHALPTVRRVLDWYRPYLTDAADLESGGVLADVPEWNLVDWSSILLTGASSILTALWARGLAEYAEISEDLGNRADAEWANALRQRVTDGFDVFWDERRGTYVDQLVDGRQQLPASQLAGATAILAGLVPEDRVDRVLAWISDPGRLVTRSWIGGSGGYDVAKIADQIKGIQRIDWDAENEVVRAEPFAAYHVHDAYRLCDRPELLTAAIRKWSEFLVDGYDTFGECWGWGTPVHGWSSTPTKDLVTAVLGVTPDAPGFARARIAPAYGVVADFSGAAPTPAGLISVEVHGPEVSVQSPVPFRLRLADGSWIDAGPGGWSSR